MPHLPTLPAAALLLTLAPLATGCSKKPAAEPSPADDPPAEAPAGEGAAAPEAAPATPGAGAEDVCFEGLAVAWKGTLDAPGDVERNQDAAQAKADGLLLRLERDGEAFSELVREASDLWRDDQGYVGTFRTDDWPSEFSLLKGELLALSPSMTTPVVETPYGYVIARRCVVDTARFRKILVRFAGAEGAPEGLGRSEEEARKLADGLHALLAAAPDEFARIARTRSDDEATREAGGLVGPFVRGRLPDPPGAEGFSLAPFALTSVRRVPEGFVFFQRLPKRDAPAGEASPPPGDTAPSGGATPAGEMAPGAPSKSPG